MTRRVRDHRGLLPCLLVAVYASLGFAWAMTNAPFGAPDESQHYLRALGIWSDGQLAGPHAKYTGPVRTEDGRWVAPNPAIKDTPGTLWRRKLTRAVTVPPGKSPAGMECMVARPDVTPACASGVTPNHAAIVTDTDVGSYPPLPYLLPAAATAIGSGPAGAVRMGRIATLAIWIALLAAAVWMLWDAPAGGLSLLGLVVAITPSVVFVGSSLSDSSLEIVSSAAFLAALLRVLRDPGSAAPGAWVLAAISGGALVLARSLGVLWLLCAVAIAVVTAGWPSVRLALRSSRRWPALAGIVILLSLGLAGAWQAAYGPHAEITLVPSLTTLHDGVSQLRGSIKGVIGEFGYGEVQLGVILTTLWSLMVAALLVLAIWVAGTRGRVAIGISCALAVAVPIYVYAAVLSHEGVQTQARHLLPLMVLLPLVWGEILRTHALRAPTWTRLALPIAGAIAAIAQLVAWWENSHRNAVGQNGHFWFLTNSAWAPPAGWVLWTVIVVAGTLTMLIATARSAARRRGDVLPS
jgi:hypothetical protein